MEPNMNSYHQDVIRRQEEDRKIRNANQAAAWRLAKRTVKWTLLGVGVVAVANHFVNKDNNEEEKTKN